MPKSLDLLLREFLLSAGGTALQLVTAGVVTTSDVMSVRGATQYTVSVSGINGDVYAIDARLTGGDWYAIPITIDTDSLYQFSGVYDDLRIRKVSGSGTTANLIIRYGG